jgi:ubiquinone/menaquinone biosynthesis C-methylase UbiE
MDRSDSYTQACVWFSDQEVAPKYPSEFRQRHWRDEHEKRCILKAFRYIPTGAHVLDLPCGTGRLTRLLLKAGYKVTAADINIQMLKVAQNNYQEYRLDSSILSRDIDFKIADIRDTGFKDNEFDAVVCHRLFHHFYEAATRKKAMAELRRISRGPVLVSFFNSFSISALIRKARNFIKGSVVTDRVPIKMRLFFAELKSQGLQPVEAIPARWGISPMWYVVAMPFRHIITKE